MSWRKWQYLPLILLAAVLLLGVGSNAAQERKRIVKITSLEWEPYTSSHMINGGNAIQHLRNLLGLCDIELQVEFYPWRRAQQVARQPGYLGYFPAWPEEVHDGFVSSGEVATSHLAIMALADSNVTGTDIDQILTQYRVGVVKSYIYPRALQLLLDKYPASIDSGASSELSLLKMLTVGRFQLAVSDPTVLQYLAEKDGIAEVRVVQMLHDAPLVLSMLDSPENQADIALIKSLLRPDAGQQPRTALCSPAQ